MGSRPAFPSLKEREPRIKTSVPARLRLGARWTDALILDISSRGLLIHSSEPVERGMYLELRRSDQVIVARVVWRTGSRAGLQAQDRLPVESIVTSDAAPSTGVAAGPSAARERRRFRRDHEHERSRLRGRAMEFTCVALVGATLSVAAFTLVSEALAQPLAKVRTALSGQASLPADSR